MSRRSLALVLAVLLPLGLGLVAATSDGPVPVPPTFAALGEPTLPFVPKQGFLSATWFCAGAPVADGGNGGDVIVVNPSEGPLAGTYTVFSDTDGTSPVVGSFEVPARGTWSLAMEEVQTATAFMSAMVEISGGGGYVEQRADHEDGAAVSPCSNSTSDVWHFADGYTLNDSVESLVITNPYPDDAIIDIQAFRPGANGSFESPSLQGVAVRGQSVLVIDSQTQRLPKEESVLALSVVARSGRVVVARSQRYVVERVGFTNTLGSPSVSPEWYFAAGENSDDIYFERYTIFNPGDADVTVSATVLGVNADDPEFVNVREDFVEAGSVVTFTMSDWERLPTGAHHLEFSTESGDGVVIERALTRRAGDSGFVTTVTFGAPQSFGGFYRWSMAVGTDLAVDGVLVVANRDGFDGTVTVKALGPGGEVEIPGLEAVPLPAGGSVSIAIPQLEAALGVPLVVESTNRIVVERAVPRSTELNGRSASLALPG